jgi:hypothetical protein
MATVAPDRHTVGLDLDRVNVEKKGNNLRRREGVRTDI